MSYDFYLLPAGRVQPDVELARLYVAHESASFGKTVAEIDSGTEASKQDLLQLVLRKLSNCRIVRPDFAKIAQLEGITADEAQRKYRHIEINSGTESVGFQITIFDWGIAIRHYFGISGAEWGDILQAVSLAGDFVVFDPQKKQILDLRRA